MLKSRYHLDSRLAVGLSLMATAGFWLVARAHSWFFSDDYWSLSLATTRSFVDFVMTPIDVHFLPLHRLATWSIYTLFPLNFDVALFVMCAFHMAGVWILYRTLEVIGESPLNGPLTALCGTSFYAAVLLTWWTVGIARFPYVVLSLAAICQYLKVRQETSLARIVALLACIVSAAAFFTKALLIPGVLAALEVALSPGTPRRNVARNIGVITIAALAAIAYYRIGVSYGVDELRPPPIDWAQQKIAISIALTKTLQSVFGLVPPQRLSASNWLVVALWAAFLVTSVWRDRFNAVVWILGAGVVIVNFLVITLSQRIWFGPAIVGIDRYYFENLYLIALFIAVIVKRMRIGEWLANTHRGRVLVAAAWLAVGALAIASQVRFLGIVSSPEYAPFRTAREFGRNLTEGIADLRRTHQGTLRFAEGNAPLDVLKLAGLAVRRYSQILPIFDADIEVVRKDVCLYTVEEDGTIRPPSGSCP